MPARKADPATRRLRVELDAPTLAAVAVVVVVERSGVVLVVLGVLGGVGGVGVGVGGGGDGEKWWCTRWHESYLRGWAACARSGPALSRVTGCGRRGDAKPGESPRCKLHGVCQPEAYLTPPSPPPLSEMSLPDSFTFKRLADGARRAQGTRSLASPRVHLARSLLARVVCSSLTTIRRARSPLVACWRPAASFVARARHVPALMNFSNERGATAWSCRKAWLGHRDAAATFCRSVDVRLRGVCGTGSAGAAVAVVAVRVLGVWPLRHARRDKRGK